MLEIVRCAGRTRKRIHNIAFLGLVCWDTRKCVHIIDIFLFGVLGTHKRLHDIVNFLVLCAGIYANVAKNCLVCWDIRKRIHNIASGESWLLKLFCCVGCGTCLWG